jgi:hypothetical protein
MRVSQRTTLLCWALLIAACGSNGPPDPDGGAGGSDVGLIDGGRGLGGDGGGVWGGDPFGASDAGRGCSLADDLGSLGMLDRVAAYPGQPAEPGSGVVEPDVTLLAPAAGGNLSLGFRSNAGLFSGRAPEPGRYSLAEEPLDYRRCGVCVVLFVSLDLAGPVYMADAGSLTIDEYGPRIAGSAADLELVQVTSDDPPRQLSCRSKIGSLSFSTSAAAP